MRQRRPLAFGTALAIAVATVFVALPANAADGRSLAATGSDSMLPWIIGAIVVVLVGAGALLLSRRKRPGGDAE